MRILCVFGRHAYGDPARGESYEHANFLPALRALGHEVELLESFDRSAYPSFAALNRAFLEKVQTWRPDVVFTVLMHYELWHETLALVRERGGVAVLNWGTDDSWKYSSFTRHLAPFVDVYATTSHEAAEAARRDGLPNVVLTQWAASESALAAPLPAAQCRYPVTFVGAAYGARRKWIHALRAAGIEVACFGHGWPNGPVDTTTMRSVTRESVVSLNFSDASVRGRQIKARVFEVPACGGLLLTQQVDRLGDYYAVGHEVDVFATPAELVAKVRHYLEYPEERDAVAQAGHLRTKTEHIYGRRLQPLLERAVAARRKPNGHVHAGDLRVLEQAHLPGPLLRALRVLLVGPLTLLFGQHRGPRAARRLLFAICSRVAGRHTYSARGWPGRLFYRES